MVDIFVIESMLIQRNNLTLLLKLVIKDLFKNRTKVLNSECRTYFDHLFILLEKCLQHGLKRMFMSERNFDLF